MSRVLIWKNTAPGREYDIFRGVSCSQQYHSHNPFNIGNRLWFQGLMSVIDNGENQYHYLENDLTTCRINAEFDFIILPMANIFNEAFLPNINSLEQIFTEIRIPVYVLACGAQAENYDALDQLIEQIGEPSKRFIASIYNTGGEFGLRGEFTKEFFNRLGFSSAVVTGCPSMFQFGRNFSVDSAKANILKPIFNGKIDPLKKLLSSYSSSLYMDQDCYWHSLYFPQNAVPSFKQSLACYCNFGQTAVQMLAEDRIRLIPDMNNWRTFLMEGQYNYSFGSRIHGNIMAILSGIPATVVAVDTRTREMAEFFGIPYVIHSPGHVYSGEELVFLYEQADYTTFNEQYTQKYDTYARFLSDHGIVSALNEQNTFFRQDYTPPLNAVNPAYYHDIQHIIAKNLTLLKIGRAAVYAKNALMHK